jgi:prepilin signal peptidase PulO-like enzyme (type II secretory pathway)
MLMNKIRPIVAFLSFVGFFLASVLALISGIWGDSGRWDAVAGVGMIALYFLLCFLSSLSFVRRRAMILMAVLAHAILVVLLLYDLMNFARYNIHVELILAPIGLLFVTFYALMVTARLREGSSAT